MKYLAVYGALQALVVQQDSVRALVETCGQKYPEDERLRELRLARHLSIGHPTKAKKQEGKPSSFIVQVSLQVGGFNLLTFYEGGAQKSNPIAVGTMIQDQRCILSHLVEASRNHLMDEDRAHRRRYRSTPLAPELDRVRWHVDKARELIHLLDHATASEQAGKVELPLIENSLIQVQAALEQRGDWEAHDDVLVPQFTMARHCIARMRECFEAGISNESLRLDAEAFVRTLDETFSSLHSFLEDLDRSYDAD